MTELARALPELVAQVNAYLHHRLTQQTQVPERLFDAMQYVVNAGGKRLRPLLVYCSGLTFGADLHDLDRPAAAVELIHTYSLTHDDLPAMDDDDLRRGKPTCHIAFDEATAILAGDALQCLAFEILGEPYPTQLSAQQRLQLIQQLSIASGAQGMAGGQSLDLSATGQHTSLTEVERIHTLKTGRLIKASIMMGATCATLDQSTQQLLTTFAEHIGLAYQIHDDILDIESTTEQLGKAQGADLKQNKATYPSIVGLAQAKALRDEQSHAALKLLDRLDTDTDYLRQITCKMIQRQY